MAVDARVLARKQAIVSKLVAIEELAGVDVLRADKTGTLTQNKLTLGDPFCLHAITADELIFAGALASQAANNDTIDLAVLGGLKDKEALKPYQVTHFTPFDPVHKRTEATVKGVDGKSFNVTKGAPQVILALSANAEAVKAHAGRQSLELAQAAVRSAHDGEPPSLPDRANLARGLVPTGLDSSGSPTSPMSGWRRLSSISPRHRRLLAQGRRMGVDDHLEARLAVDALDEAIEARDPPPGLIHHSDRGVQYASSESAARLDEKAFSAT